MAANDNRAMVEAAREFTCAANNDGSGKWYYGQIEIGETMADFAISQSALAVAAERTRIGERLWTMCVQAPIPIGYLERFETFSDELRAERANDADR